MKKGLLMLCLVVSSFIIGCSSSHNTSGYYITGNSIPTVCFDGYQESVSQCKIDNTGLDSLATNNKLDNEGHAVKDSLQVYSIHVNYVNNDMTGKLIEVNLYK